MSWTTDDLVAVHAAQELHITSSRADGSLRKAVPIWHAAVDGELYVRSAYGPESAWYRHVLRGLAAHVRAGGVTTDVEVEHLDAADPLHDAIDAALREKYASMPQYVAPIVTPESRAVTLRLTPVG